MVRDEKRGWKLGVGYHEIILLRIHGFEYNHMVIRRQSKLIQFCQGRD